MRVRSLVIGSMLVASGACGAASAAPAWPRPTAGDSDGGESLAPRPQARAIAAVSEDDRPAERAAPEAPAADKPAAAATPPAVTPSAAPAVDEPITGEEIVIEIED